MTEIVDSWPFVGHLDAITGGLPRRRGPAPPRALAKRGSAVVLIRCGRRRGCRGAAGAYDRRRTLGGEELGGAIKLSIQIPGADSCTNKVGWAEEQAFTHFLFPTI